MSLWPSVKAKRLLDALLRLGWQIKRQSGSHKTLARNGWPDFVFAFHDGDVVAPKCWRVFQSIPAYLQMICKIDGSGLAFCLCSNDYA